MADNEPTTVPADFLALKRRRGKKAYRDRYADTEGSLTDCKPGLSGLLGRIKRKFAGKRPAGSRAARLARLRLLLAARKRKLAAAKGKKPTPTPAKNPVMRSIWARLTPQRRQALIAAAVKKNPKLKRKLVIALLKRRMMQRKQGAFINPGAQQASPVPAFASSPNPAPNPARAPIEEARETTPAEDAEAETMEAPLSEAAEEETEKEEGGEEAAAETQKDMAEEAAAEADEMTEPTAEEQEEATEEASNDGAEAAAESAGDLLLGYLSGKRKQRRRQHGRERMAVLKARHLAGQIESASGGEIKATHILGAVKLISKAKGGDVKAKKGIKAVVKMSKKPGMKKAKKAAAKLKIAHQVMKKTGTAKGQPKKRAKLVSKGNKGKLLYANKVSVQPAGLTSYSAHQRGLAMIPGFARTYYGSR
jgi:hypothetical protein